MIFSFAPQLKRHVTEQRLDKPDNVVVVLMDSLNRHLLGAYGGTEFETPNLDAFAARSVRFDKHYAGSLPCVALSEETALSL